MSTPVSDFYDPVRFLLGDHDDTDRLTQDTAIARGVRTLIKGADISGYTLDGAGNNLSPNVTASDYMRIAAKVALRYVGSFPERQSAATRGWRESIGSFKGLKIDLEELIYKIESGGMFEGWQSLATWLEGFSGVRESWLHLVRLKVDAPFNTVTLTSDGISE